MAAPGLAVTRGVPLHGSDSECRFREADPHAPWKDVVLQIPNLPATVRSARITLVQERVLDQKLFQTLTSQSNPGLPAGAWEARLELRRKNLVAYLDRTLVCVFFRLPGSHYTFEIDGPSAKVVHWEWQAV